MSRYATVLIIDFGSKYTQNIARKVRDAGVYSVILPCTAGLEKIKAAHPSALILSGGAESIYGDDAPPIPDGLFSLDIPILGIGFGMQIIAHHFGGSLKACPESRYALEPLTFAEPSPLVHNISSGDRVWIAAADCVTEVPAGFSLQAATANHPVAAMADPERRVYAVQFHPEAEQTDNGDALFHNFLFSIAGLEAGWNMASFIERTVEECRTEVGDSNVVLGLSGGIDSTVVAALLHKAIGPRLHCIFVDTGLMRHEEGKNVLAMFNRVMPGINLHAVQAQDIFLGRLAGVSDPEEKRKIIGHTFIEVFEEEARKISGVRFLGQGTVYPDIIESYTAKGTVIKSHHNVGGLPEKMNLKLIEPLQELFKDEVRAVGTALGLPDEAVWRHPFPGPGLAVRLLGEITKERLDILRAADHIVIQELRASDWYSKVWQGFAVLLPLRTVGMRNNKRTYDNVIALRIVDSLDAMTAQWSRLPAEVLDTISRRILQEVPGVNRVVFDISSKPPSTIEWE